MRRGRGRVRKLKIQSQEEIADEDTRRWRTSKRRPLFESGERESTSVRVAANATGWWWRAWKDETLNGLGKDRPEKVTVCGLSPRSPPFLVDVAHDLGRDETLAFQIAQARPHIGLIQSSSATKLVHVHLHLAAPARPRPKGLKQVQRVVVVLVLHTYLPST